MCSLKSREFYSITRIVAKPFALSPAAPVASVLMASHTLAKAEKSAAGAFEYMSRFASFDTGGLMKGKPLKVVRLTWLFLADARS